MRTLASLIILSASLSPLTAQWPSRPTAGVPRTPDGKPNLSAPAPRSEDGKPDLSGVWRIHKSYLLNAVPDLKPEDMQPWAAALYKRSADNCRNDTDGINCFPPGPKTSLSVGPPVKIVQTPNLVIFLYEYQTLFRQVFTDPSDDRSGRDGKDSLDRDVGKQLQHGRQHRRAHQGCEG